MKKNNPKLEPKSREQAFAFQFEDDIKSLKGFALISEEMFNWGLTTLETHIAAYKHPKKGLRTIYDAMYRNSIWAIVEEPYVARTISELKEKANNVPFSSRPFKKGEKVNMETSLNPVKSIGL